MSGSSARLRHMDNDELKTLDGWTPKRHEPIVPPQIVELLGDRHVEPWLADAVRELAESPSPVDRVASVGMVARLWSPTKGERNDLLAARASDPNAAAIAWFRSLSDDERAWIEERSVAEAASLLEDLDAITTETDADFAATRTLDLVRRRDALESVSFLLGPRSALATELRTLDTEVVANASGFELPVAVRGGAWFDAVAAEDPLAWWGSVAPTLATGRRAAES